MLCNKSYIYLSISIYLSLQPFNRFLSNFNQKSCNICNLLESVIISIWQKTKWRPKWHPPRYLCLPYLLNPSTIFHQIFTKNFEIHFQLIGISYNFNMVENKIVSKMALT